MSRSCCGARATAFFLSFLIVSCGAVKCPVFSCPYGFCMGFSPYPYRQTSSLHLPRCGPILIGAGLFFHALPALSGGYYRLLPSGIGKHPGTRQTPPCGPPGAISQILVKCPFSPGLTAPLSGSGSPHRRGVGFTVPFPAPLDVRRAEKAGTKQPCATACQRGETRCQPPSGKPVTTHRRTLVVQRCRNQCLPPSSRTVPAESTQSGPQGG